MLLLPYLKEGVSEAWTLMERELDYSLIHPS